MSFSSKKSTEQKAGRLLAYSIHEARRQQGLVLCPICQSIFDATYLLKCPKCRTLISKTFQKVRSRRTSKKMELDFFAGNSSDKS